MFESYVIFIVLVSLVAVGAYGYSRKADFVKAYAKFKKLFGAVEEKVHSDEDNESE